MKLKAIVFVMLAIIVLISAHKMYLKVKRKLRAISADGKNHDLLKLLDILFVLMLV